MKRRDADEWRHEYGGQEGKYPVTGLREVKGRYLVQNKKELIRS